MSESDLERESQLYDDAFEEPIEDTKQHKRNTSSELKELRRQNLEKARIKRKQMAEAKKREKEMYDTYEYKDMKVSKSRKRQEPESDYSDENPYSDSDYSEPDSPPPKRNSDKHHKKERRMTKQEEKLLKMEKIVYGLLKAQKEAQRVKTAKKPKSQPVNYTTVVNVPKSNDNKVKLPLDLFNR